MSIQKGIKLVLMLGVLMPSIMVGLTSCSDDKVTHYQEPSLNFNHLRQYKLNVAQLKINDHHMQASYDERLPRQFQDPTPKGLVEKVAQDRFQLLGQENGSYLEVVFLEETMMRLKDEKDSTAHDKKFYAPVIGLFKKGYETYKIGIRFKLNVVQPSTRVNKTIEVASHQIVHIPEKATMDEKKYKWFLANEQLIKSVNKNLDENVPQVFSEVLR